MFFIFFMNYFLLKTINMNSLLENLSIYLYVFLEYLFLFKNWYIKYVVIL
jgi:hypothetical protein